MVQCAAYGCYNSHRNKTKLSFFRFPKNKSIQNAWLHYIRRDQFKLTDNHHLCEEHFSIACYERHPNKFPEVVSPYTKPRLHPDAIPDIPLQTRCANTGTHDASNGTARSHGAYRKRQRAEILSNAMKIADVQTSPPASTNMEIPDTSSSVDISMDMDVSTPEPMAQPCVRMINKKVQVNHKPPQRTRCHQTNIIKMCTTGTQTDTSITNNKDIQNTTNSTVTIEDTNTQYDSDDSDIEYTNDMEYDPFDDNTSFTGSTDDEEEEEEEEEGNDMNYVLEKDPEIAKEKQYLVSESCLAELLSVCPICCSETVPLVSKSRGIMISTTSVCVNGHTNQWKSQPCHKKIPWTNIITAGAVFTSGINSSKALHLFNAMNLQMMSSRTYCRIQRLYVVPAINYTWDYQQAVMLRELNNQEVVLGGDARCDSPGYSAKYGSYSLMDLSANKILDTQLVQCNEVKSSVHMELEGLKRGITFLERYVNVKALVTDRHTMVKKYMKDNHADIRHYFDVWHVAKGVSKKLEAAAKKKKGSEIRPWIKSAVNHMHWVSSSCGDDGDLKVAKWTSLMNHVCDKHQGHSAEYPSCEHGQLTEERAWLKSGSVPFKLMKDVIQSPYLLRDVPKLSPVHQTYGLEVFHSVVNHFAPKSTHFCYASMQARVGVAALHYNENSNRAQAKTRDGELRFTPVYSKSKKGQEAVVKAVKLSPTFEYVIQIRDAIVERRLVDCPSYALAEDDVKVLHSHHPPSVSSTFPNFAKNDLVRRHRSRFRRDESS